MKLINQSHEIIEIFGGENLIEIAGRTCYKSEEKITETSSSKFVKGLIKSGHHSVLEHGSITVRFITNRGVTHELVRHRLASYSQESTRYVNYGGKDIEFILPVWLVLGSEDDQLFRSALAASYRAYCELLGKGWRPEQAREVLPNSLKTEIVMTANFREWRHVFTLRCSPKAHPQMRALMLNTLIDFQNHLPGIFGDLYA